MRYMPWGATVQEVVRRVIGEVPLNGKVLDLMCGPGYLLEQIHLLRPDVSLTGIDLDPRYVTYASARSEGIRYVQADVRDWNTDDRYDGVLCTGSVHHLPYSDQPRLFGKLAMLIKQGGFGICAELCIGVYADEQSRQLAAAELGYAYLKAVIENRAPPCIIVATVDILRNDVLADGEYKNSLDKLVKMAEAVFTRVTPVKTWPNFSASYGDYLLTLRNE